MQNYFFNIFILIRFEITFREQKDQLVIKKRQNFINLF
jgi:hypothetical protein